VYSFQFLFNEGGLGNLNMRVQIGFFAKDVTVLHSYIYGTPFDPKYLQIKNGGAGAMAVDPDPNGSALI
jgi:hypothetical protein